MSGSGLALFFTRGVTLEVWHRMGHLSRELLYYRRLGEALGGITFVTYGGDEDAEIAKTLPDVRVLHNRWNLPPREFARKVSDLYANELKDVVVFKSNQLAGAEAAIDAGHKFGRPAIVRCGWIHSTQGKQRGYSLRRRIGIWAREWPLFRAGDTVIVTTERYARYVRKCFLLPRKKVKVVPNFIPTDIFSPSSGKGTGEAGLVCYVGRLSVEKNPLSLVQAMRGISGARLCVVGNGPLIDQMEKEAAALNVEVAFLGNIPNIKLPDVLNRCTLFVMPSLVEGHPKALLEAMSCGLPVVVTPVPGIREIVTHGVNAYVCRDTSPAAIRDGIKALLADEALRNRLGRNAREFVVRNFDIDRVLETELSVYEELGIL